MTGFSFESQIRDIADYLNKISSLDMDKEMEIKFLASKERELGETFKLIEEKEEKLLKEIRNTLLEMSSKISAIKDLKMKIMHEREECAKKYTSLTEGNSSEAEKTA